MTGEKGPYSVDLLHRNETDETRPRLLIGFSSAKHERLLTLLDEREYDHVEIVSPGAATPRNRLANLAADVGLVGGSAVSQTPTSRE
jgi:hypothetical protein